MYNNQLEPITVELANIYLDPNNPRFWIERDLKAVNDEKVPEEPIQDRTFEWIWEFGVEDLYNNILRNGFLPLDRIVVRPLQGHGSTYVVVEGNRRIAALKLLHKRIASDEISEEGIDDAYLNNLRESTQEFEVLLYKGTETDEVAWILQGIRHISGIRNWSPAQRARLVTRQIENENMLFSQAGQKFGLSAIAVGRLYRGYKGLEQMKQDDEYGAKAKNEYFSLFEEAYKNVKVREWLGWNDSQKIYTNYENLRRFYSWIVPDEDNGHIRRIHNPKHMSHLATLLEKGRDDLIGQIDRFETTIEEAKGRLEESQGGYDWKHEVDKAKQNLKNIPNSVMLEQGNELSKELKEIKEWIDKILALCIQKS